MIPRSNLESRCFSWILLAQTLCGKPLSRLFARTLSYSTLYLCNLRLQSTNCSREAISTLCSRTMLWRQPSERWPVLLVVTGVARAGERGREADEIGTSSLNVTMESRFILLGTGGQPAQAVGLWITQTRTTTASNSYS